MSAPDARAQHTPKRFVIEGTWSGYTSAQSRVVHRSVHRPAFKALRAWAEATHGIRYTDGTMLYLSVRDARPREKVDVKNSYGALISDCAYHNVSSVEALQQATAARTALALASGKGEGVQGG